MARIPQKALEQLKQEVSLQRLVESSGITLKKHGKDYLGLCPFHDDKAPSLVISPDNNLWHCLGACDAGGDVIEWVRKFQGVSFRHAVEILREGNPIPDQGRGQAIAANAKPKKPISLTTTKPLQPLFTAEQDGELLLNQVCDYYHQCLKQSPEAIAYLKKRGLDDADLIDTFQLGFSNRTLGYHLPLRNRKAGAFIRGKLQKLGILRNSGHEHFTGSIVVPVLDIQGFVVEIYGRKINDNLRAGTPYHLYLPGPHAGVWNESGLEDQEEVILCEALIDAMTFWVAGYKNVTASYGTAGFTDDHLTAFKQSGIKRVLIAYDRDEAGNAAAEKLARQLKAKGFDCYRLNFPKGMDANAYALEVKPANKSLGVVIRSVQFMGEGESPERQLDFEPHLLNQPKLSLAAEPEIKPDPEPEPESPPLPASAIPPKPEPLIEPDVKDHEVHLEYDQRKYRVRGLNKNTSYDILKVNVLVSIKKGDQLAVHVDTFDLYSSRHRNAFARLAAAESGIEDKIIQRDLGQLLLQLESLQDKAIQEALKPAEPTAYTMDETERQIALNLLTDKQLTTRIIEDFTQTGLVGEPSNALMGYLACVSRKLKSPLAIVVQSTTAAGKSALMDAVLRFVPEEDRVHYSAMTGQSLFYLGATSLKHKILGIAEEEGVRQAAYALKLLQSQGELSIASTGKDPQSGKHITEAYRVEGPVMLFLTTTAIDIDEELLNRCVVLSINETRAQTAAIQQRQRQARTLEGLTASHASDGLIKQHQNAQRLLRPLAVVNPFAEQLAFADSQTRTRRDHEKYLTLIDTIALLHQYQRKIKTIKAQKHDQATEYIEVTLDDIKLANELAHEILGHSLDEIPPPTRRLLQTLHTLVADKIKSENIKQNAVRFTRRDIREASGLSNSQVSVHLTRLVELEYVYAHFGKNGRRFVYELVFDGQLDKQQPQLMGLIDVKQLKKKRSKQAKNTKNTSTTRKLPVTDDDLPHRLRPANGQLAATLRTPENSHNPSTDKASEQSDSIDAPNTPIRQKNNGESYRTDNTPLAAEL